MCEIVTFIHGPRILFIIPLTNNAMSALKKKKNPKKMLFIFKFYHNHCLFSPLSKENDLHLVPCRVIAKVMLRENFSSIFQRMSLNLVTQKFGVALEV